MSHFFEMTSLQTAARPGVDRPVETNHRLWLLQTQFMQRMVAAGMPPPTWGNEIDWVEGPQAFDEMRSMARRHGGALVATAFNWERDTAGNVVPEIFESARKQGRRAMAVVSGWGGMPLPVPRLLGEKLTLGSGAPIERMCAVGVDVGIFNLPSYLPGGCPVSGSK